MKFVMNDSRAFTDFSANCSMYMNMKSKYSPGSSDQDFRGYLQTHAEQIMSDMRKSPEDCKSCPICKESLSYKPQRNVLPQSNIMPYEKQ